VRTTTPPKKSVRKLQREIDQIKRAYDRDVERLTQEGASQDEIMGSLQNASLETDMAQEQIQIILTARLFHEANRLSIPSPRYTGTESDMWEKSYRGQVYLSFKGQTELRSSIRREKKERWEARALILKEIAVPLTGIIGAITGVIGATTGLIAFLNR
jgi:hypothetical protein